MKITFFSFFLVLCVVPHCKKLQKWLAMLLLQLPARRNAPAESQWHSEKKTCVLRLPDGSRDRKRQEYEEGERLGARARERECAIGSSKQNPLQKMNESKEDEKEGRDSAEFELFSQLCPEPCHFRNVFCTKFSKL